MIRFRLNAGKMTDCQTKNVISNLGLEVWDCTMHVNETENSRCAHTTTIIISSNSISAIFVFVIYCNSNFFALDTSTQSLKAIIVQCH